MHQKHAIDISGTSTNLIISKKLRFLFPFFPSPQRGRFCKEDKTSFYNVENTKWFAEAQGLLSMSIVV